MVVAQRGSEFWRDHMWISPEAAGASEGPPEDRPYQHGILDLASSFEVGELCVQKPVRFGWSKIICSTLYRQAKQVRRTAKVWNSRKEDSDKFVRREINPMFRDIQGLRKLLPNVGKKSPEDTLRAKIFPGFQWLFDGAHSADNFKAESISLGIGDEVSTWPTIVDSSGSAIDLIRGRLIEDPMSRMILGSTPKELPQCLVTRTMEQMEFVFLFHSCCPRCFELQPLFMDVEEDYGLQFDVKKSFRKSAETVRYVCRSCGESHSYAESQAVQHKGLWMTEDGEVYLNPDDGLIHDIDGPLDRWGLQVGCKSNILLSASYSWTQYLQEYLSAQAQYEAGDPGPAQTFRNEKDAEGWEDDEGIKRITSNVIAQRAEEYPPDGLIPSAIKCITGWADVQGDRIEVGTYGWYRIEGEDVAGESGYALESKVIPGDTIHSSKPWEELEAFFLKEYITEDGEPMSIFLRGVDRGWEQSITKVEQFCRMFPDKGACIPTVGNEGIGKELVKYPHKPTKRQGSRGGVYLTTIHTNTGKSMQYRKLGIETPEQSGYIHFPAPDDHHAEFGEEFYKQLVAAVPVRKGNKVVYDSKKRRDEIQDIFVGNLALIRIAQIYRGVDIRHTPGQVKKKYDLSQVGARLR